MFECHRTVPGKGRGNLGEHSGRKYDYTFLFHGTGKYQIDTGLKVRCTQMNTICACNYCNASKSRECC